MVSTITAVEAGPRPLLAYLLLHHRADAATLSATLGRDDAQVSRSLRRLARRGLVAARDGQYEIAPARRTAVADYAEGALTLRALAQARS
jgi:DNA-binding MarR family transcriptional regulator